MEIRNHRISLLRLCGWLVAMILASQSFAAAQIQMVGRRDYMVPGLPESMLTADFNGDGRTDIAVADGVVSVLLQAADGSFLPPVNYTAGTSAYLITKGDFNHDGFNDLAVSDGNTATVSVLLGNGDGTFRAAVSYPVPAVSSGLAVADLNRDGRQDLLVMNSASNTTFTVLLGKGDGTFQPGSTSLVDAGKSGSILQLADLNRDDKWDAVFVSPGWISVLLGNGDGTFAPVKHYGIGPGPSGLTVADFNGDGVPDLAQVDYQESFGSILLGNGDGTFQPQSIFSGVYLPNSVRAADFNGDGKQDLAILDFYRQQVTVLAGNGDGTFESLSTTPTDPQCCTTEALPMIVAELNGDHRADVLITNYNGNTGSITLLSGQGDGSFKTETNINVSLYPGSQLVASDVNADGKMDFVATNGTQMLTLLGTGTGTFQAPLASAFTGSISSYVIGRFNADANRDLAFSDGSNNTIDLLFGNGKGYFGAQTDLSFPEVPGNIFRADFNGDGILDLVVNGYNPANSTDIAYILLGKGHGAFSPPTPLSTGFAIAVADFNGDGRPDLLLEQSGFSSNSLEVLLGNGDGTFQNAVATNLSTYLSAVAAGDLNRDGKADLVLTYQASFPVETPPVVLLSNGDGTFGSPQPFSLPDDTVSAIQIADMNRDGNPDLVVAMFNLSVVVLLPGDGQGHFGTESVYGVSGGRPTSLVVADLNGDGKPDVATNNGTISILFQGK